MEKIIKALTSNRAKAFYWQLGNAMLIGMVAYMTEIEWQYAALAYPVINMLTKYVNLTYLK